MARAWGSKLAGGVQGWVPGDGLVVASAGGGDRVGSWQRLRESAWPPAPRPHRQCRSVPPRARENPGCRERPAALPGRAPSSDGRGAGAGGGQGELERVKTLPASSLLTWSYELSQHGVSHCTASAGCQAPHRRVIENTLVTKKKEEKRGGWWEGWGGGED